MQVANESEATPFPLSFGNSVRRKLLFGAIAVFAITSCVCAFFTLATFDKLYSKTRLDQHVFVAQTLREELLNDLCPGLAVGKAQSCPQVLGNADTSAVNAQLEAFVRNADLDSNYALRLTHGELSVAGHASASVVSGEGRVLFSSDSELRGEAMAPINGSKTAGGAAIYNRKNGWYSVKLPLDFGADAAPGNLVIKLPEHIIGARVAELLEQHKMVLLVVLLAGVGLLTMFVGFAVPVGLPSGALPTKRITLITVTLVCAAQIFAALGGAIIFRDHFPSLSWERTEALGHSLKADLERHLDSGENLKDLLDRVDAAKSRTPGRDSGAEQQVFVVSLRGVYTLYPVRVEDGQIVGATSTQGEGARYRQQKSSGEWTLQLPLRHDGKTVGFVSAQNDPGRVDKILAAIGVEVLLTVVISMLCLVELLLLIFKYLERRMAKQKALISEQKIAAKVHYGAMRPTIFLFLFGIDLSAALVPLQMERLYQPILNLPKDVVLGLPVSALFLMVGVTFLIAGAWMDRRGWHEPFLIGVLITGVSKFYAWMAPDALHFIAAMAGIGFGYGLALMAAQGFVMDNTTDRDKAHGIAYFFAGVYAGSIGGTAIGAMLAERIGYDLVFLIGSGFVFLSFGYGMMLLRDSFRRPKVEQPTENMPSTSGSGFVSFLLDRNVWSLILFCSIPSAVAVIGFLNYFSPVYLSRLGVSESIIGGVLTLYGISMVYVSPLVSKGVDATERKDIFILIGGLLGGCAFLSFFAFSGLFAVVLAILFLGLSMSCLQSSQTTYTLKLEATHRFGSGKAVAMVRASSRIGQMLGPMVFSWLVMAEDTEQAVTYFGIAYLVVAFLFIALRRREDKKPEDLQRAQALTETSEAAS